MGDDRAVVIRYAATKHPNADRLWVANFQEYQFVTGEHYADGELGVYIPEGLLVPDDLIDEMELTGMLAGPEHNRVKAIKLRGIVSQGIFYGKQLRDTPDGPLIKARAWNDGWQEGDDVTEALGLIKWIPPIPLYMVGVIQAGPPSALYRQYELENWQRYPHQIRPHEDVCITEKIHGSLCAVGVVTAADGSRQAFVTSKGYLPRGMVLSADATNVYWRAANQEDLVAKLTRLADEHGIDELLLLGEVLGVQDLKYGLTDGRIGFRAFDLYAVMGNPPPTETAHRLGAHRRGFLSSETFAHLCDIYAIPAVPVLYEGPYSAEVLNIHRGGTSTLAHHMREGVVVRPRFERHDDAIGRVILKAISPAYLVRKDGTEYN